MSSSQGAVVVESSHRRRDPFVFSRRVDSETRASSRASARARGARGKGVPVTAVGSVDRGRRDSVTLSICPCVFEDGSARQRPGATRVSKNDTSDERRKWRAFVFRKRRSRRKSGRGRARSTRRALRRTCAPARSTDLPVLRRSCRSQERIAISQRWRGWDGRKGETRRGDARANRFSKPSGKSDVVRSRPSRRRGYVFARPRRAGKARTTHHVDERRRDVRQGLACMRVSRPGRGVGERSRIRGACVRSAEVDRASVRILKTSAR